MFLRFLLPFLSLETVSSLFMKFIPDRNPVIKVLELFLKVIEDCGSSLPSTFVLVIDNLDILELRKQV